MFTPLKKILPSSPATPPRRRTNQRGSPSLKDSPDSSGSSTNTSPGSSGTSPSSYASSSTGPESSATFPRTDYSGQFVTNRAFAADSGDVEMTVEFAARIASSEWTRLAELGEPIDADTFKLAAVDKLIEMMIQRRPRGLHPTFAQWRAWVDARVDEARSHLPPTSQAPPDSEDTRQFVLHASDHMYAEFRDAYGFFPQGYPRHVDKKDLGRFHPAHPACPGDVPGQGLSPALLQRLREEDPDDGTQPFVKSTEPPRLRKMRPPPAIPIRQPPPSSLLREVIIVVSLLTVVGSLCGLVFFLCKAVFETAVAVSRPILYIVKCIS